MAKKHRHKIWYAALFQDEANRAFYDKKLPEGQVLFDNASLAYGYKVNERFESKKDENGNPIVNDKGYAQLKQTGKVTVIGLKGKDLNWKQIEKAPKGLLRSMNVKGDTVKAHYPISLWKQNIESVFEETKEQYEKFINSPMGVAGGLQEDGDSTTEEHQSENQLVASE